MNFRFSRKFDFLQRQIYNVLVIRTVTRNQANDAQLTKGNFVPQLTSSTPISSDENALHKFDTSSIEKKIVDNRPDMPKFDMKNPYVKEPVKCILCKYNVEVDYKNIKLLSQFISPFTGDMYDKSITGLCTAQHKKVTEQVKKAKLLGYMPYVYKDVTFSKDPRLFNALKSSKKFS